MDSPEVKAGYILTQWNQVTIPPADVLLNSTRPALYDPSGQESLADYQQFLGESTADTILSLIRAGRQLTPTNRLWGACYGHLLWWPEGDWPPSLAGQLGLGRILASSELDFLVGPPQARDFPTTLLGSVHANGKFYLAQPAATVTDVRRLCSSPGGVICSTAAQARSALDALTQPAALKAALVVDEDSLAHLSPATDLQRATLTEQAQQLTTLSGLWEGYLLRDLLAAPDCPLFVMAATYRMPEQLREPMLRRLQAPGATVVWAYAAGALDSGFIDPSAIFALTGLRVTMFSSGRLLRIEVTPSEAEGPLLYGPEQLVQPWFPLLEGSEALGQIADQPWTGLGLRREGGAVVVYSAAPGVPAPVLADLLREPRAGH
jgi:hypothetical protein